MKQAINMVAVALCIMCMGFLVPVYATERIITNPAKSDGDKRFDYALEVLYEALDRTSSRYGAFELMRYDDPISRKRALRELQNGHIHIFLAPTRLSWEQAAIPVRIPIRKGILGYKLLLIRKENQGLFDAVKTQEDLQKLIAGAGAQWNIAAALRELDFKVAGGVEYESLFQMLNSQRFDFFPRGVNEIFQEIEGRKNLYPDLVVEGKLALYLPSPTYFFVSPQTPHLAERLEVGLQEMVEDGSLDQIFEAYHRRDLERANLGQRRIISLENKTLSDETPLMQTGLWFHPFMAQR